MKWSRFSLVLAAGSVITALMAGVAADGRERGMKEKETAEVVTESDTKAEAKAEKKEARGIKEEGPVNPTVFTSKKKETTGKKEKKQRREKNVVVVPKQIEGKVGGINSRFISIVYKSDKETEVEYEIALTIGDDLELVNKEDLDLIKIGDTIKVNYEEKQETYEERKEDGTVERKTRIVGRWAKKITFLHPVIEGVLTSE